MELRRRNLLVYGLLLGIWILVVGWQVEEHYRVKEVARAGVINRSKDIANTLSAFIRGLQFRGAVFPDRLEPVLNELVNGHTNELVKSSEVVWIALLNAGGDALAAAGNPTIDPRKEIVPESGLWMDASMTREYAVAGAAVRQEGATNQTPTVVPPPFRELTNRFPEEFRGRFPRREPRPDAPPGDSPSTNPPGAPPPSEAQASTGANGPEPPPSRPREMDARPRRPFWARGLDETAYQTLIKKRELHGLVLAISTESFESVCLHDLWLRYIISFFAGISALGAAVAWRTLAKTSELQIRLVRASELNTHLREMNLAAAGLAHETRNPLNIIRGLAQMISRESGAPSEIRNKSRAIVDETDKVAAQLNEFINYSRPRELRPTVLSLAAVATDVARALKFDIEEKKIRIEIKGESISVEADEQMLRQALFNLVLNAVQAVGEGGEIQILCRRRSASEASIEVSDNGPGVPAENRLEIFKPYVTTHQKGTGLGLAIVQQIVQAHGWEIQCLSNEPRGAIFCITHLKLAARH